MPFFAVKILLRKQHHRQFFLWFYAVCSCPPIPYIIPCYVKSIKEEYSFLVKEKKSLIFDKDSLILKWQNWLLKLHVQVLHISFILQISSLIPLSISLCIVPCFK